MRLAFRRVLLVATALALVVSVYIPPVGAQAGCQFSLGFKALHDAIPAVVGDCLSDEIRNPETGDAHQATTRGLLVWRMAENLTLFNDGFVTWTNGPDGSDSRQNREALRAAAPGAVPIVVFFSHNPGSGDDFRAVFPMARTASGPRVATAALESLIEGPTPSEQAYGYFSDFGQMLRGPSTCGGRDFTLSVAVGLATVRFCRDLSSAGVGQDARARSQIEATLRQFPTVERVRLLTTSGQCLFDASGLDLCLGPAR